jgi:hypothetical protein
VSEISRCPRRAEWRRVSTTRSATASSSGSTSTATPDEGTDSCEELTEVERFREVIVGAGVQADDLVLDGIARGEHEHGCARATAANLATDLDAVAHGEDDVEDDGIVFVDGREKDGASPSGASSTA